MKLSLIFFKYIKTFTGLSIAFNSEVGLINSVIYYDRRSSQFFDTYLNAGIYIVS